MIGSLRLFADAERALQQRLRLRVTSLILVDQCEIVDRRADGGVFTAQRRFDNGKRALVERLGVREAADRPVERGEVVDTSPNSGSPGFNAFSFMAIARVKSGCACVYRPCAT